MWPLYIFAFAFILRLVYILQAKSVDPVFYYPIMDALYHHEWAISIMKGGWLGKDAFFRAPLYPHFLSLLYQVFGANLLVPRIVQSIIGSFNCVLIAMIGTTLFNKKIGIIAGTIACIYPLFIYFDNELLIPTLLCFLVLLGTFLILKQNPNNISKGGWFYTGVIWGLAAITRPNVLLFLVVLPFWLIKRSKKMAKIALLYGGLGVIAMIIPITIRNYVVSKEFVLIAWQGGTNFYIGNNPESDGFTAIIPGTRKSWWGGFYDAKRIAEEAMARTLRNSEIDQYWMKQGMQFISREPLRALYLFLKKTYLFFGGQEISNNRDIYFFSHMTYLKFLVYRLPFFQFPFGLLFPLALCGIYICMSHGPPRRRSDKRRSNIILILIFIISYALSFIIFFVCARYRLVIIPFFIMFATLAVIFLIDTIKKKKIKRLLVPSIIFTSSYLFFNADVFSIRQYNPALNYLTLGVAYKNMGRIDEALDAYSTAIRLNPTQPDGYYNIGNIYAEKGDYREAKKLYLKAIELDPRSARAYNNLGNIYFESGEYETAIECYNNAIRLEPDYQTPFYHAGLAYTRLGDFAKAESVWLKALTINPNHERIRRALERIRQR